MPLLTVFTPVFNLEKYIEETIISILSQTFTDFEYILIDDCSSDKTIEIIESFNDPRIILIKNDTNQGISHNRNYAIDQAKGKYIAMIDGDDLALPERLEKQIEFLEKNDDYGIVGTEVINIDKTGAQLGRIIEYNIPNDEIPSQMLFNNYIATSSAMIRVSSFCDIRFKKEFVVAEDYEVWIQLIRNWKIGHIRLPLTKYRIHNDSISIQKKKLMIDTEIKLIKQQLNELKCKLNDEEFQVFLALSKGNQKAYFKKFKLVNQTITKLAKANKQSLIFNKKSFLRLLFRYWHIFYVDIKANNLQSLKEIKASGMYELLSIEEKIKLIIKSFLKFKSK